jgi:hypothetical protein
MGIDGVIGDLLGLMCGQGERSVKREAVSVCLVGNQKVYGMGPSPIRIRLVATNMDGTIHEQGIFAQNMGSIDPTKSVGPPRPSSC